SAALPIASGSRPWSGRSRTSNAPSKTSAAISSRKTGDDENRGKPGTENRGQTERFPVSGKPGKPGDRRNVFQFFRRFRSLINSERSVCPRFCPRFFFSFPASFEQ